MKKQKNTIISIISATALVMGVILGSVYTTVLPHNSAYAIQNAGGTETFMSRPLAPMTTTAGNHVYITWWSNKSGDWDVFFRESSDGGHTYGPKINLSNSPGVTSENAQIAAEGNNVYVSWWEHAKGKATESVVRASNDGGKTFGNMFILSNGTSIAASPSSSPTNSSAPEG
jgi:hypothetical protein